MKVIDINKYRKNKHTPYCAVCGEEVDEKGKIDSYFPYFSTYNRCSKCLHVIKINPKNIKDE